jgi:hypothetical protein
MQCISDPDPKRFAFLRGYPMLMMRLLFVGYFVYITLLLLTPNPFQWVGSSQVLLSWLNALYPLAHSICFVVLTVFALLVCQPLHKAAICASLFFYAAATELIQTMIPPRTGEWQDWFQDIAGIIIGFMLFWLWIVGWNALRNNREEKCPEIAASN